MNWLFEIEDRVMSMFIAEFLWRLTIQTEEQAITYARLLSLQASLSESEFYDFRDRSRFYFRVHSQLRRIYETTNPVSRD